MPFIGEDQVIDGTLGSGSNDFEQLSGQSDEITGIEHEVIVPDHQQNSRML